MSISKATTRVYDSELYLICYLDKILNSRCKSSSFHTSAPTITNSDSSALLLLLKVHETIERDFLFLYLYISLLDIYKRLTNGTTTVQLWILKIFTKIYVTFERLYNLLRSFINRIVH